MMGVKKEGDEGKRRGVSAAKGEGKLEKCGAAAVWWLTQNVAGSCSLQVFVNLQGNSDRLLAPLLYQ
jgi:hypothetical protein